jgi:hypothetical protein
MTQIKEIKKGSYGFTINLTAENDDGTTIDITGMTPWLVVGQLPGSTHYSGQCTLGTYPASGECYIVASSGMTDTAGIYKAVLEVNTAGQHVILNNYTFVIGDTIQGT